MPLSSLAAALRAGSKQWFAVLVNEFGGLDHFLFQYPHEFSLVQRYNTLYVILSPSYLTQPFQDRMPSFKKYT